MSPPHGSSISAARSHDSSAPRARAPLPAAIFSHCSALPAAATSPAARQVRRNLQHVHAQPGQQRRRDRTPASYSPPSAKRSLSTIAVQTHPAAACTSGDGAGPPESRDFNKWKLPRAHAASIRSPEPQPSGKSHDQRPAAATAQSWYMQPCARALNSSTSSCQSVALPHAP